MVSAALRAGQRGTLLALDWPEPEISRTGPRPAAGQRLRPAPPRSQPAQRAAADRSSAAPGHSPTQMRLTHGCTSGALRVIHDQPCL